MWSDVTVLYTSMSLVVMTVHDMEQAVNMSVLN